MQYRFQGSLFSGDFLENTISDLPGWCAVSEEEITDLATDLRGIFARFPIDQTPNEATTEQDLIWPVLERLGWSDYLRQQNFPGNGSKVPDGLLFADRGTKERAQQISALKRYELGVAIVESKRWRCPLDNRAGEGGTATAPSTQMLHYLRRVEDLTTGRLRWGILTNGKHFRLYYQGARSVAEQFFELDLPAILDLLVDDEDPYSSDVDRRHWLKIFFLIFRREAFLPTPSDDRTFHQRALQEGRFYQERVAANLSDLVFRQVFPDLAKAIAAQAPLASGNEVRDAALILLYRILFIFYAEDRALLPVRDSHYAAYGLRKKVRDDVDRRKKQADIFSTSAAGYGSAIDELCRLIDCGDSSIGLPPYNGGLFNREQTPLLSRIRLSDAVMAKVIDALSFTELKRERKYVNYRDLSVQQLGSIYERLLEQEVVRVEGGAEDEVVIRPNIFARKNTGSYYTPDDLVRLILKETLDPLIKACMDTFRDRAGKLAKSRENKDERLRGLQKFDPAVRLLELKICDPAMGSGHFLVNLVDYLADRVITAMGEAEATVNWGEYVSPLGMQIDEIRSRILANAKQGKWVIAPEQLDDRCIIRRMALKRCVYGVDKNPMAVELAKLSLWLHSFTVGAPLSFLDHHLRCGDSLFGSQVCLAIDRTREHDMPLLLHSYIENAIGAEGAMRAIEALTDAEIEETRKSAGLFAGIEEQVAPLAAFLSLAHALDWLDDKGKGKSKGKGKGKNEEDRSAINAFFAGQVGGNAVEIACGRQELDLSHQSGRRFAPILAAARSLIEEERFLHWQPTFLGIWSNWRSAGWQGGFDAVIGNPPWDRIKLQQVEWFAARRPSIAMTERAADRERMIARLQAENDPLAANFAKASARAETTARMARTSGDYPLLSGGDVNLYSLFVERAMTLVKPGGMVGLLTPSGIASDKTATTFFQGIATSGRLNAFYDFENRRQSVKAPPFFPDVDGRFKFAVLSIRAAPTDEPARCGFFLDDVAQLDDPERCFQLTAQDFARVNPNTGTAPIFRTRRDAELTKAIYGRLPVLVDRSSGNEVKTWPVRYACMFHMTNDSGLFRTRGELEEREGAWPIGGNRFASRQGEWVPLYEGKMIQAFNHRGGGVIVNPDNLHNPGQPMRATPAQLAGPNWLPDPRYWVLASECSWPEGAGWTLGFRDITRPTDARSVIAALVPTVGFGNKIPLLKGEVPERAEWLLAANLNAMILDFAARQKIQSTNLNLYILEQLPVVPPDLYATTRFGPRSCARSCWS